MLKRIIFLFTLLLSSGAMAAETKTLTVAGGCFWCMEPIFESTDGVISVTSGYAGGTTPNPNYDNIGDHVEAVQVVYDPAKVGYEELLKTYWFNIDVYDEGGQFVDRGTQYNARIFYHDEEQKKIAERMKADIEKEKGKPVVTKIVAFTNFYPAEEYHQDFYKKNLGRYNSYKKGSGREEKLKEIWNRP